MDEAFDNGNTEKINNSGGAANAFGVEGIVDLKIVPSGIVFQSNRVSGNYGGGYKLNSSLLQILEQNRCFTLVPFDTSVFNVDIILTNFLRDYKTMSGNIFQRRGLIKLFTRTKYW